MAVLEVQWKWSLRQHLQILFRYLFSFWYYLKLTKQSTLSAATSVLIHDVPDEVHKRFRDAISCGCFARKRSNEDAKPSEMLIDLNKYHISYPSCQALLPCRSRDIKRSRILPGTILAAFLDPSNLYCGPDVMSWNRDWRCNENHIQHFKWFIGISHYMSQSGMSITNKIT